MMTWCLTNGGWAMLAGLALALVLAIWVIARLFPAAPDAGALLDARLARGEIDLATHRLLHEELSGKGRPREARL